MLGEGVRAIVIGHGSIGQRHARLLHELGVQVTVVSRRPGQVSSFATLVSSVREACTADPTAYVVVANETSVHAGTLESLAAAGHRGPVLVEKPLLADSEPIAARPAGPVYVGYNLRFHPLLQSLRVRLTGQHVCAFVCFVGQYLPDWHPDRDYRVGYSALQEKGGGVLRDLSHEIDYLNWLFGPWQSVAANVNRTGMLEIETEDLAQVLIRGTRFASGLMHLDYLARCKRRSLLVQTTRATYELDLVEATLSVDGVTVERQPCEADQMYRLQHLAVLSGEQREHLCSLAEGEGVMGLVAAIEGSGASGTWTEVQ